MGKKGKKVTFLSCVEKEEKKEKKNKEENCMENLVLFEQFFFFLSWLFNS